jgi:hypothetical protein
MIQEPSPKDKTPRPDRHPRTPPRHHPPPAPEAACPHCGYSDLRHYAGEATICPACGAVLHEPPPAPAWLDQWPPTRRSTLANWFYAAVRSGLTTLPAIVDHVSATLHQRLQWTSDPAKREWLCQVLTSIREDPHAAEDYAGEVWALEQLPADAKARLKAERAQAFMIEAMRGREPSARQVAFLRSLGYTGAPPRERAEASAMIDRLLREKGAR